MPDQPTSQPKLRWYQYRLRTLLLLVTAAAVFMSWVAVKMKEAKEEQKIIDKLEELNGGGFEFKDEYQFNHVPEWVKKIAGENFLATVVEVKFPDQILHTDDEQFAQVKGFKNLRSLLVNGGITNSGMKELREMTHLKRLQLFNMALPDEGMANLQYLNMLEELTLEDCHNVPGSSIKYLKGLTQLRVLTLDLRSINDAELENLKNLTQLKELLISSRDITDSGLEKLKGLTQLEKLDLHFTSITDEGLDSLKGMTQLKSLNLSGTDITDKGLGKLNCLSQLQSLELSQTKITDSGLQSMTTFKELKELFLHGTKVTKDSFEALQKELPNLKKTDTDSIYFDNLLFHD